jgi:hypothetical protein
MMRTQSINFFGVTVIALLTACAGNGSTPATMTPSSQMQSSSAHNYSAALLQSLKFPHSIIPRDLYVGDLNTNAVDVLRNKTYREVGAITSGVDSPVGLFLDTRGNLYVANQFGGDVSEYAPGNMGAPNFIYNSAMGIPGGVTVDRHGNVYEADYGNGLVNEYFQGSNVAVSACSTPGGAAGVAVDTAGDVFVTYQQNGVYTLAEFVGGLRGCRLTVLQTLGSTGGGLALDANGKLLEADGNAVVVIPPPYTGISGTIGSGFSGAATVNLNRKNTLAFVADYSNITVTVINYPGGTNQTVLSNGFGLPFSVVDWPNFVP